jgi:hypothetical protein
MPRRGAFLSLVFAAAVFFATMLASPTDNPQPSATLGTLPTTTQAPQSQTPGSQSGSASGAVWASDTGPATQRLLDMRMWCKDKSVIDSKCSFEYFNNILAQPGDATEKIKSVISQISSLKIEDDLFIPECHHAFHAVGQTAPRMLGVTEALKLTPDVECQGGMVHGVIQTWSQDSKSDVIARDYATVCNVYPQGNLRAFCAHGVGHAIGVHFPQDIIKTTLMCDEMYQYDTADGCVTGTIMEFGGSDFVTIEISKALGKPRAKDSVTQQQKLDLCTSLPERLWEQCSYKVFQLFRDLMPQPDTLMVLCEHMGKKGRESLRKNCAYSIGEVAVSAKGLVTILDPDERIADFFGPCMKIPSDLLSDCTRGFIETLMRDVPLNNNKTYKNPCDSLPQATRTFCEAANESAKQSRQAA